MYVIKHKNLKDFYFVKMWNDIAPIFDKDKYQIFKNRESAETTRIVNQLEGVVVEHVSNIDLFINNYRSLNF
jgi:hypothetical protein